MKSVAQRALGLLILILVLVTLTGVAAAAKSLLGEGRADACCGQTVPADQQQESSPCAAECSCSSCLTLFHPSVPQLQLPFAVPQAAVNALPSLHHSQFVAAIDYPPEIA